MTRERFAQRALERKQETPFASAEEAWMWYSVSQVARDEGARPTHDVGESTPPCTPDDIYRVVKALYAARDLSVHHVRVLFEYGLRLLIPNSGVRGEAEAASLWEEALERMSPPFLQKGIVA